MGHQTLLTRQAVEDITGFRRAFIYQSVKAGTFPRPIRIGQKSVRWVESEVREWIEDRIREDRERSDLAGG